MAEQKELSATELLKVWRASGLPVFLRGQDLNRLIRYFEAADRLEEETRLGKERSRKDFREAQAARRIAQAYFSAGLLAFLVACVLVATS